MLRKLALVLAALSLFATACSSLEGVATLQTPPIDDATSEATSAPDVDLTQNSSGPPPNDLADMIEDVLPSVVNVRVSSVAFDPLGDTETVEGQGSGVVIDESGIVITNNHVVSGATEVNVIFNDGTKLDGTVIGTAPENDVAVVRVQPEGDLTAIELGTSEGLRLGDDVVAIGFPLGLGGTTVTKGIVSALDRDIQLGQQDPNLPSELRGLLQTDAAINPGNSGGALVDTAGRLIGINTAAARASSAENVGFAIPIDTALPVAEEIIEDPPEERSYMGVQISDLTPAVAAQLGIDPDLQGALIAGLFPDGPAEAAGLEQGDVIVSIGGQDIEGIADVNTTLRDFEPGETVDVVVVRDGERLTVDVELGQRPTTLG